MKNKIRIISISLIIIGLITVGMLLYSNNKVSASDVTITGSIYHDTSVSQVKYGHKSPKGWTPLFKVNGVPNDLGTNNAFCLDPNEKAPKNESITGHTESYNNKGELIVWNNTSHKYFLYFLYGGPGWEENKETIKQMFVSEGVIKSSEGEDVDNENLLYAYSHALIALAYHSEGYQGDRGLKDYQITGLKHMQDKLVNPTANGLIFNQKKFDNLKIYYVDYGESYQDILFWTYTTPKAYIELDKVYEPEGTSDSTARKFRLYEANLINGTYQCKNLSGAVARTDTGNTGYRKGNKYYLGWKRDDPSSDSEDGEALLDIDKVYCIWESNSTGYVVSYTETTTSPEQDVTVYDTEDTTCPADGCVYGIVDFTDGIFKTPSSYNYKKVKVTNTGTEETETCIEIEKSDAKKPSYNIKGVKFSLYTTSDCTGTAVATKTTNADGIAKFTGLSTETDYYYKEVGGVSTYVSTSTCSKATTNDGSTSSCVTKEKTNAPYGIGFYKVDEDGNGISGVKFKVKATGASNYITVSARSSNYDNCYVYKGTSSSGTTMTTDSNGEICIARIPGANSVTYVAEEQSSSEGYVFEGGSITGISAYNMVTGSPNPNNKLINKSSVLNFYKVDEDGDKKGGAEFVLTDSDGDYVKVKSTRSTNTGTKGCYIFDEMVTRKADASTLVSNSDTSSGYDIDVGEVCVIKLPVGTYTATETKPLDYHTFGNTDHKSFTTSDSRQAMSNNNKFTNYRTEFEFTKTVSDESNDPDIQAIITAELKNIPFAIYDNSGNKVDVISTSTPGVYEYAHNNIDGPTGASTQELHLNDNRKIIVYHLPVGKYTIREEDCCCDSSCTSPSATNCYGYYAPKYSEQNKRIFEFEITKCSSPSSSTEIDSCRAGVATKELENVPTKVEFTKDDFYKTVDPSDTVKFENDEERSAFDEITFKVYYLEGGVKHYVKLLRTDNTGSCTTDASHSNYMYVADQTRSDLTEEIHTCGGHINITHLCRGRDWYIEEISVSGKSVFILPETEAERTVKIELDCCNESPSQPKPSETVVINDKPTRVIFEKRDSKYGTLINDETTTFEVYRCAEGVECHPSDYDTVEERSAVGMTLVKFNPRSVINGDEEDSGVEVYRTVTNVDNVTDSVTSLHPYHGKLVLRYMEAGYNYVLLETASPKGYRLPTGRNAETAFTISTTTVQVDEIDVPNKPTSLLIKKYDEQGNLLEGAEFRVYESTTCGGPVKPKDKEKTLLRLKTIRDGVYENREVKDTDTLITCTDRPDNKCSDIVSTLTLDEYVDTHVDFDKSVNQNNERVEMQAGEILIQYLDYGKCYVIEEVKAPKGHSLPEDENDRFVEVEIKQTSDVVDTGKDLVNKPTHFTFYKFDDHNNLIDGGEYKLQKLNQNKKYEDLTVTEEELNGKLYYKVDPTSENKVIRTLNGEATVYYLEEGQYRIVETKAPAGMELPKKEINVAVFYVDENGSVIGNSLIANKPKTEKISIKPQASAELIVNISTGIDRIKYGLIIGGIVVILGSLIIVRLKSNNKKKVE
ncbi:MAG: hypothetical protein IKF36_04690 [Bacilli bacterium]|nr:hypothetical protein [Bacilli bacterium]